MRHIAILFLLTTILCFTAEAQSTKQLVDSAAFYKNIDYSKVIFFAAPAYKKAKAEKNEKLTGQSAYMLGIAHYLGGNYDEALRWYFISEKSFQNAKDTSGLTDLYSDMCVFYVKQKKFAQANELSQKAINFAIAIKDTSRHATALNNRGLLFYDAGKPDSAITAFNASYVLYKRINQKTGMSYCLDYLSSTEADIGNYAKSFLLMNRAKDLRKGIGDKTGEAIAINNIGELYLKQNKLTEAAGYFLEAIAKAHALSYTNLEMYAYSMLAKTYQQQGNYKAAFAAQSTYIEKNQKFQDAKRIKTIEELQTQNETEKKKEQIRLLNKQNTIQSLEIG